MIADQKKPITSIRNITEDLAVASEQLVAKKEAQRDAISTLEDRRAALEKEFDRLQELERQRQEAERKRREADAGGGTQRKHDR